MRRASWILSQARRVGLALRFGTLDALDQEQESERAGGVDRSSSDWRYHGTGCRFSLTLLRRYTVHLPAPIVGNRNYDAICGIRATAGTSKPIPGFVVSVRPDMHRRKLHRKSGCAAGRGRTRVPADRARYKSARGCSTK